MRNILLLCLLVLTQTLFAQKKTIDYQAYSDWKVIKEYKQARKGQYFAFTIEPYEGNTTSFLLNLGKNTDTLLIQKRASNICFNRSSTFFTSTVSADYEKIRALKIKETKSSKMPKDSLLIFDLTSLKKTILPNVKKYDILDSTNLIVGLFAHNFKLKSDHLSKGKENQLKKGYTGDEMTFFVTDKSGELLYQEKGISAYYVDREQQTVMLVFSEETKGKTYHTISQLTLNSLKQVKLKDRFEKVESAFASSKKQQNFIIGKIFDKKQQRNELYRISSDFKTLDSMCINYHIDSNYEINPNSSFREIPNSDLWQIELSHYEPKKEKDTLLKEEQVKLDIWSWKDNVIQPKQLKDFKNYYKQKFKATVNFDTHGFVEKVTLLENDTFELKKPFEYSNFTLGTSSFAYNPTISFDYPWREDSYLVNLISGEKRKLIAGNFGSVILSPDANYLFYQATNDTNLIARNLKTGDENCITCSIKESKVEDLNGMEYLPSFKGSLLLDANHQAVWFNSSKALYRYEATTKNLIQITPKEWVNRNIKLNCYKINTDSVFFNRDNIIIEVFDLTTKVNTYYTIEQDDKLSEILSGYFMANTFLRLNNFFLARIQNNEVYPNFNRIENKKHIPITDVNPQQKDYNWSKVESIKWTTYNGIETEGLLYRPENYDSTKSYPLIVYYYETSSEDIHRHVTPRPTASIIFSTEYASSGYFVLMPDIHYQIGHPAKGAYNAIMSGTDYVLKKYPQIDSCRMGLQGQSWGGYQTAQMITMTQRYAAAMAGAPVSNMFSAYGGIRWGTGLSRQFQYEHSQSRIGKTIWEAPELYTENSPLFGLPKVKTPLLIMHNDEDGAVPWYQGIELFMGLNRLQKPVWLLNYNGDDHNLMKKGNRKDLSKRMKAFFDFYLNNGEEPDWMKNGRPAKDK